MRIISSIAVEDIGSIGVEWSYELKITISHYNVSMYKEYITNAIMYISSKFTFDVVLKHRFNNTEWEGWGWNRIISTILAVGLYLGLLTIVGSHFFLLDLAYNSIASDKITSGAIHTILVLDDISLPNTLLEWSIFLVCALFSMVAHEIGHMVALINYRIRIYGLGTSLFLCLPYRFFVSFDMDGFTSVGSYERATVRSAGIAANYGIVIVALLLSSQFNSQIVGWFYSLNIALAIISAIPLSKTDGDKILSYMLLSGSGIHHMEIKPILIYIIGFISWLSIAGSMLVIILTLSIDLLPHNYLPTSI